MTSPSPTLTSALSEHFGAELRSLRRAWELGDAELRPRLESLARDLLPRLPPPLAFDASVGRQAALTLRLLELAGAELPQDLDPVLTCALRHLETRHVRAFGPLLLDALDVLPAPRTAALRRVLAPHAVDYRVVQSLPTIQIALDALTPEILAWLEEELRLRSAPPASSHSLYDPSTLLLICEHRGEDALGADFEAIAARIWADTTRFDPGHQRGALSAIWRTLLERTPPARREALLLAMRPVPWEHLHLAATPAMLQHIERQLLLLPLNVSARPIAEGLRQLGAPLTPTLIRVARAPEASLALRALVLPLIVRLCPDDALDALIALINDAGDEQGVLLRRLYPAPLPTVGAALLGAWGQLKATTQQALMVLLTFRALHEEEEIIGLLDQLAARQPQGEAAAEALEQLRAELGVRRPALLPGALFLFQRPVDDVDEPVEAELRGVQRVWRRLLYARYEEPGEGGLLRVLSERGAVFAVWRWICLDAPHERRRARWLAERLYPGEALRRAGLALLRAAPPHATMEPLYLWLLGGVDAQDADLHRYVLEQGGAGLRELAIGALGALGPWAVQPAVELLGHRQGAVRAAAARVLRRAGAPEALPALRSAVRAERTAEARRAMQDALKALAPAGEGEEEPPSGLGTWQRLEDQRSGALMTELREVLYLPPSIWRWARVADLLARLELRGDAAPGAEYVKAHLDGARWPASERFALWGWDAHPQLAAVVAGAPDVAKGGALLPIAALYGPQRRRLIDQALPAIEAAHRGRKLPAELVELFLSAVHAGWEFCEEHDLNLEWLEIVVDGGSRQGRSRAHATTTRLQLHCGFCAWLLRAATLEDLETTEAGLRRCRVRLPARHRLRDQYAIEPRERWLDLRGLPGLTRRGDAKS